MTTVYKVLGQTAPTANTWTTSYTTPAANSTVVSSMTICNQSGSNANVSIAVCVANAAVAISNQMIANTQIVSGDTVFLTLGVTVAATDTIRVYATAANVAFSTFGSEIY